MVGLYDEVLAYNFNMAIMMRGFQSEKEARDEAEKPRHQKLKDRIESGKIQLIDKEGQPVGQ